VPMSFFCNIWRNPRAPFFSVYNSCTVCTLTAVFTRLLHYILVLAMNSEVNLMPCCPSLMCPESVPARHGLDASWPYLSGHCMSYSLPYVLNLASSRSGYILHVIYASGQETGYTLSLLGSHRTGFMHCSIDHGAGKICFYRTSSTADCILS
jgi:hypothetical protein